MAFQSTNCCFASLGRRRFDSRCCSALCRILSEKEYGEYFKEIEAEMKPKGVEVYVVEEVTVTQQPLSSDANGDTDENGIKVEKDAPPPAPKTEYRKKVPPLQCSVFNLLPISVCNT